MISLKPCSRSSSNRNSITGFCRMGIIGLGITWVIGCTLVPLPAAKIIAFIGACSLPTVTTSYAAFSGGQPIQSRRLS